MSAARKSPFDARRVADAIQDRKQAAQLSAARSASDGDFDTEAYWRARSEGLQQAESIVRAHMKEAGIGA